MQLLLPARARMARASSRVRTQHVAPHTLSSQQVDLLPEEGRARAVKRATKLVREALGATKFAGAAVIPVAAKPGAP